jgi:uncharacterized membrane protein
MTRLRIAFVALAIAWAALLPAAAFAASRRAPAESSAGYAMALAVYRIGSVICHQRPERSFRLFDVQLPVCARCTGIYLGAALAAIGLLVRPTRIDRRSLPARVGARRMLVLAVLPSAATLVFEWSTGVMPAHAVRALSGAPIGAAVAWIVCRATPAGPAGM